MERIPVSRTAQFYFGLAILYIAGWIALDWLKPVIGNSAMAVIVIWSHVGLMILLVVGVICMATEQENAEQNTEKGATPCP